MKVLNVMLNEGLIQGCGDVGGKEEEGGKELGIYSEGKLAVRGPLYFFYLSLQWPPLQMSRGNPGCAWKLNRLVSKVLSTLKSYMSPRPRKAFQTPLK